MKSDRSGYKGQGAGSGFGYLLGFIGAVVYYWQHSHTFWQYILGFLKSLVWPAFLVYHLMHFLKM